MKPMTGIAFALAALVAVPAAFAEEEVKSKSTTTTTSDSAAGATAETESTTETEAETEGVNSTTTTSTPPTYGGSTYGYTAPATTTTTTTSSTSNDYYVHDPDRHDNRPRVRSGFGLNVFGAAGTKDTARLGVGGRIEFVLPFGLALGGSYTQHFTSEADRTAVRPLLGEIGWSIPVVHHLEVRPMVGLGYAFASASTDSNTNNTGNANQTASAGGSVNTGGFDVAPGAKVSYVARGFEIFTLPKYHFISGNNFLGVEVGAGARF